MTNGTIKETYDDIERVWCLRIGDQGYRCTLIWGDESVEVECHKLDIARATNIYGSHKHLRFDLDSEQVRLLQAEDDSERTLVVGDVSPSS